MPQVAKLAVVGPFSVVAGAAQYAWACLAVVWTAAATLAGAARSGWRALVAGARLAPAVGQGAQQASMQPAWSFLCSAAHAWPAASPVVTYKPLQPPIF